jgi:putative aminopeptidase FrvX
MARRTKEQKRIDDAVETACNKHAVGRQFDIFSLSKISDAGKAAAVAGADIDAAVLAAAIQYDLSNKQD